MNACRRECASPCLPTLPYPTLPTYLPHLSTQVRTFLERTLTMRKDGCSETTSKVSLSVCSGRMLCLWGGREQ